MEDKIALIKKNIDFCEENNMKEALLEGGKYFKSFSRLINESLEQEISLLKDVINKMFPCSAENIILSVIESFKDSLRLPLTQADAEELKKAEETIKKAYADKYVEHMLKKMN